MSAAVGPRPGRRAGAGAGPLADGEWHRLHPATPLLRGGIAFIAIAGAVVAQLRERLLSFFLPAPPPGRGPEDPIDYVITHGYVLVALLIILGVLLLLIAGYYLSWRMHTFRITDDVVEVRSGILFRTSRKGRLDRIQGVNVARPWFARLFGAARLEVSVAGHDGNVNLAYLSGVRADELRREILLLASGARPQRAADAAAPDPATRAAAPLGSTAAGEPGSGASRLVGQRVAEFFAPERDPHLAPETSVVTMHVGRLVGSTVLGTPAIIAGLVLVGFVVALIAGARPWVLVAIFPSVLALGPIVVNRVLRYLRYSIAATPDGIRVGYGLASVTNDTVPPGRIHSISISQDLLWRPFDWWEVKINRASSGSTRGAATAIRNATILPVGSRAEVLRVLELALPDLLDDALRDVLAAGLARATAEDGYVTSPRRGQWLRWFSWRRNGFALRAGVVLLRRGAIWRELVVVPTARLQSVAVHQGPLERLLRLAKVDAHTVAGPITPRVGALDAGDAQEFFRTVAAAGIASAAADRSHRWRILAERIPAAEVRP